MGTATSRRRRREKGPYIGLPIEVFEQILADLSVPELLRVCTLVSRDWCAVANEVVRHRLDLSAVSDYAHIIRYVYESKQAFGRCKYRITTPAKFSLFLEWCRTGPRLQPREIVLGGVGLSSTKRLMAVDEIDYSRAETVRLLGPMDMTLVGAKLDHVKTVVVSTAKLESEYMWKTSFATGLATMAKTFPHAETVRFLSEPAKFSKFAVQWSSVKVVSCWLEVTRDNPSLYNLAFKSLVAYRNMKGLFPNLERFIALFYIGNTVHISTYDTSTRAWWRRTVEAHPQLALPSHGSNHRSDHPVS